MMSTGSHSGAAVRGIVLSFLALGFAFPLGAQSERRRLAEFTRAMRANQAALRNFGWESRTEIEVEAG